MRSTREKQQGMDAIMGPVIRALDKVNSSSEPYGEERLFCLFMRVRRDIESGLDLAYLRFKRSPGYNREEHIASVKKEPKATP